MFINDTSYNFNWNFMDELPLRTKIEKTRQRLVLSKVVTITWETLT